MLKMNMACFISVHVFIFYLKTKKKTKIIDSYYRLRESYSRAHKPLERLIVYLIGGKDLEDYWKWVPHGIEWKLMSL